LGPGFTLDGLAHPARKTLAGQAAFVVPEAISYQVVARPGGAQFLIGAETPDQEPPGFPADFSIHQAGEVFA
jgi:hypothetical protein